MSDPDACGSDRAWGSFEVELITVIEDLFEEKVVYLVRGAEGVITHQLEVGAFADRLWAGLASSSATESDPGLSPLHVRGAVALGWRDPATGVDDSRYWWADPWEDLPVLTSMLVGTLQHVLRVSHPASIHPPHAPSSMALWHRRSSRGS